MWLLSDHITDIFSRCDFSPGHPGPGDGWDAELLGWDAMAPVFIKVVAGLFVAKLEQCSLGWETGYLGVRPDLPSQDL